MKLQRKAGAWAPGWIPLVALIVAGGVLHAPAPAHAAGVHTALAPFEQSVALGAEFDVELDVTEADAQFNGFDTVVSFDPAALTLMPLSPISLQQGCLMTGACSAACGNTFHRFTAAADSVMITDILLCNQIALTGPGQLYKLHFKASNTPQVTYVRIRHMTFYFAGMYVTPVTTADCVIGIGVTLDAGTPRGRELRLRAAPNPAAGSVTLTVEAAAGGEQRVAVYDVSGRLVRELSNGWYAGGVRAVPWDGRDSSGARAPAGIYLVSLRAGSRVVRTHVTLLK